MNVGMNLLLWTASVGEEQFPLLAQLKEMGYVGVELPLFDHDAARFRRVGAELDAIWDRLALRAADFRPRCRAAAAGPSIGDRDEAVRQRMSDRGLRPVVGPARRLGKGGICKWLSRGNRLRRALRSAWRCLIDHPGGTL